MASNDSALATLESAAAAGRRVRLGQANGSWALIDLAPRQRANGCWSLAVDGDNCLRILQKGPDLHGAPKGPWAEFRATPGPSGGLLLHATKSKRFLDVEAGQFVATEEETELSVELASEAAAPAKPRPEGEAVQWLLGDKALPWVLRPRAKGDATVLTVAEGTGNLRAGENGRIHINKGGDGVWAQWRLEATEQGTAFQSVGHPNKYLTLRDGKPALAEAPSYFKATAAPAATAPYDPGVLSLEQLQAFKRDGYLVLKGAVSRELVEAALRVVNGALGRPDSWRRDEESLNNNQLKLDLHRGSSADLAPVKDVLNRSKVWSAVNRLLGQGNVAAWSTGCQVALRFPESPSEADEPDVAPGTRYHIDGMGKNRLSPFSLLVGVALSDQMQPNGGNLHVFPGSHLNKELHTYYKQRIDDETAGEADRNKPDLGASTQVLLAPGDCVIAHQLLAHRVGVNTSPHIRYQFYFRVSHQDHESLKGRVVEEPWLEYQGL